jgi:hypothetical protein
MGENDDSTPDTGMVILDQLAEILRHLAVVWLTSGRHQVSTQDWSVLTIFAHR